VSRWMTWLPISLKNAAKCDKWYQLQNLSITESLNANGAWKKTFVFNSEHAMPQCRTKTKKNQKAESALDEGKFSFSLISVVALSCLCLHSVGAITSKSLFLLLSFSAPSFPGNKEIGFSKKEVGSISQVQILKKKKNQNNCWSLFFCWLEKELQNFLHFGSLTWAWQDYPPNLSILFSGGKENNRDSLSQGRPKRDRTHCWIGSSNAFEL